MASGPSRWKQSSKPRPSQEGNCKPWRWRPDLTRPRDWMDGQSQSSEPSCLNIGMSWRQSSGDVTTCASGRKAQLGVSFACSPRRWETRLRRRGQSACSQLVYRIWAAARNPEIRRWAKSKGQDDALGGKPGAGAIDAAFSLGVEGEAALAEGHCMGA
eukprot:2299027-Heterocapsa_arctica.AAC.1